MEKGVEAIGSIPMPMKEGVEVAKGHMPMKQSR